MYLWKKFSIYAAESNVYRAVVNCKKNKNICAVLVSTFNRLVECFAKVNALNGMDFINSCEAIAKAIIALQF